MFSINRSLENIFISCNKLIDEKQNYDFKHSSFFFLKGRGKRAVQNFLFGKHWLSDILIRLNLYPAGILPICVFVLKHVFFESNLLVFDMPSLYLFWDTN